MSVEGRCLHCGELVKRHQAAWKVEGVEVARDGGGANQIKDRRRIPNMVWHQTLARPCYDEWLKAHRGQLEL